MLYIDDRENPKIIQKILVTMGDAKIDKRANAQVKRMQSGDYVIGQVGIEAKEINDLYHSIMGHGRSRTIVGQLMELQDTFDEPMLVVYNRKLKPMRNGRYLNGAEAVKEMGRMVSVIKKFKQEFYARFPNIKYMEFDSMNDMVSFLAYFHFQKAISGISPLPPSISKEKQHPDNRVAALATIKGISIKNAVDLLDKFGSIPNLLRSRRTQKQLMCVSGIGRAKAKTILALRKKV